MKDKNKIGSVKTATKTGPGGYSITVVLTVDPEIIDRIVCQTDRVRQKEIRVLHCGNNATWMTDPDWLAENPKSRGKDIPCGFICDHCHEPVISYHAIKTWEKWEGPGPVPPDEVIHVRQLCGCTMVMMAPETVPYWENLNSKEGWNNVIVRGAKVAHKQHAVR